MTRVPAGAWAKRSGGCGASCCFARLILDPPDLGSRFPSTRAFGGSLTPGELLPAATLTSVRVQLEVQGYVQGRGRVGEGATGDDIDARLRIRANGAEVHAARHLGHRSPRDQPNSLPDLFRREVIKQDSVDPGLDDIRNLLQAIHLDLEPHGVRQAIA